jgi:hypothetical protein
MSIDQIDIRLRPPRLITLLDVAQTPIQGVNDDETEILSVPVRLRRAGREIRMVIDGTDPFAATKPDARLIRLLLRARRFKATLAGSEGLPFASLVQREGVSRSYFTRLVAAYNASVPEKSCAWLQLHVTVERQTAVAEKWVILSSHADQPLAERRAFNQCPGNLGEIANAAPRQLAQDLQNGHLAHPGL